MGTIEHVHDFHPAGLILRLAIFRSLTCSIEKHTIPETEPVLDYIHKNIGIALHEKPFNYNLYTVLYLVIPSLMVLLLLL